MIVPDAGRTGFPARVMSGRPERPTFRAGQVIQFTVRSSQPGGRFVLEAAGVRLAVTAPLSPDRDGLVKLVVASTKPLVLKSFPTRSRPTGDLLDAILTKFDLVQIPHAKAVVRAVVASLRTVSPSLVRIVAAHIALWSKGTGGPMAHAWRRQDASGRRRGVRALVEAIDKDLSPAELDGQSEGRRLLAWLAGWDVPAEERGNEGDQRRSHGDTANGNALGAYLTRTDRRGRHPLQLFNHLRGTGPVHWVVIPIGAMLEGRRVEGTLRIAVDPDRGSPRRAVLAMERDGGAWWFTWEFQAGTPTLTAAGAEGSDSPIPESLLARLAGTGHTGVTHEPGGDGFSTVSTGFGSGGVDVYG